jgi:rfaE bifunctional protein kinase chain/domain
MNRAELELARALELMELLRSRRVLVVGDLMLDRYWWGTVHRVSPEAPVPVVHKQRSTVSVGGAANVACNIASLGGEPLLLGVIGKDAAGAEFTAALAGRGLSVEHVAAEGGRSTTVRTRIVAHNQHIVRVDEEDVGPVSVALTGRVAEHAADLLPSCEIVVISDYAKGLLVSEVLGRVIRDAVRRGLQSPRCASAGQGAFKRACRPRLLRTATRRHRYVTFLPDPPRLPSHDAGFRPGVEGIRGRSGR